ncbi:MAG: hypothetical protein KDE48_19090 [Anaerolineales bacterium]|nr:hypothetical protein [Anaerolineales bacterium]
MPLQTDFFSTYENGLAHLLAQAGRDDAQYPYLLTCQQKLEENIQLTRQREDNDERRSQRAEIIKQLNILALSTVGMSFNELCQHSSLVPPPQTNQSTTTTYNTAVIRNLLRSSFDNDSLRIFCYDHFRPVHDKFTNYTSLLVNIQFLIEYCEQQGQFDTLLNQIQIHNPHRYQQYISAIHKPYLPRKIEPTARRSTLIIKLPGDLSQWSSERQQAVKGALAGILNILPEEIIVNNIQAGSIRLQLEMPSSAANRLLNWFQNENPIIQEIGILQVQPFMPAAERQAIAHMTKQVLTRFAPQELSVSTPLIDPLLNMAILDQYVSVRMGNVSGGLGGNKLFAILIVPTLLLASRRLLTAIAPTVPPTTESNIPESSHVKAEVRISLEIALEGSEFPLNYLERRKLEAQISDVLLNWLKNMSTQKDSLSISPGEPIIQKSDFNEKVKGPLHTGSGDINIHHPPTKTEPTQSQLSSHITIVVLIVIVTVVALAVILALATLN